MSKQEKEAGEAPAQQDKEKEAGKIPANEPEAQQPQQETLPQEEKPGEEGSLPEVIQLKREEFLEVKNHIAGLEKERDEMKALAQRVQADFDNFRRRTRENDAKAADIYKAETLKSFLPVLDNFELALAHMKKDESGEAYIQGFELLQKQLVKIMTDYGISEIEAAGQKFDPHFHEAVMMVESNDKEDETVLAVFQKGYMYKDTVLRPAKVQVVHNN